MDLHRLNGGFYNLQHLRIGQPVHDPGPVAAGSQDTMLTEQFEVLGQVRLLHPGHLNQVTYTGLLPLKHLQYLQANGMAQNFEQVSFQRQLGPQTRPHPFCL